MEPTVTHPKNGGFRYAALTLLFYRAHTMMYEKHIKLICYRRGAQPCARLVGKSISLCPQIGKVGLEDLESAGCSQTRGPGPC